MEQLTLYYHDKFQRHTFDPQSFESMTIGPGVRHTVTIPKLQSAVTVSLKGDHLFVKREDLPEVKLERGVEQEIDVEGERYRFSWKDTPREETLLYAGSEQEIEVSQDEGATICAAGIVKPFRLMAMSSGWVVDPLFSEVYRNGEKISARQSLQNGDLLQAADTTFSLEEGDLLRVRSEQPVRSTLRKALEPTSEMKKNYPVYRRTPRMIYEVPEDKIQMSFPSQESDQNNRGLLLIILPPLMMLIVMSIVALVAPRGIFIIVSVVMFMTTIVTSTVQFFRERSNTKEKKAKRLRVYTSYLKQKREELYEVSQKQKDVLSFHFPSFEEMKYLTKHTSDRIWERTLASEDFLQTRIGLGDVDSTFTVSINNGDLSNREIDDLYEQAQKLQTYHQKVKSAPVVIDIAAGAVGLIGKQSVVRNEIHQLVGQIAFSHSYHDLRFVLIAHEHEYASWEWMKWLPHFALPNTYAKGMIYNEQTRDQLLSTIYEWLRERELEENEKVRFAPHFVFIVTNQALIADHVIMEYLEGESGHLGMSVLFAAESKENLSDNIHTLVRYNNEQEGDIVIQEKKAADHHFYLDSMELSTNEDFSRKLRSLDHQVGMTNSIPNSVSYLDLFKANDVSALQIDQKWRTSESAKSLAVPIGLKGKEDLVELNLHEKAHGPHGLLAGTTGSGKSEFLQTYILSLAVHFHPHEVAFLLIDYKGGGMAQPFKNMPHLLGTITNIEGSKNFSARALASIKSELKRRQRLFDQYSVNHINEYTKLYKQGHAELPMPHLFLISDEFAELKTEEPEFIRELVSAARIGRSLGVHLILATQKPGGIIDDQIWSNARFRIALKVQDASDSREILKNGDAAAITVTGRGYLQVGNNEVYELFQSAWSGAAYQQETIANEDEVAFVTDLGLIPISSITTDEETKSSSVTEIEAIVDEIEQVQKRMGIEALPSPWLPPLPPKLVLMSSTYDEVALGLVDEPELQSQTPYHYRVVDDGNVGIFGSSGYGKSTTMMSLLLSMAAHRSSEELHFYIFDFGNGTLLPLKQLKHTADYFLADDSKKIDKFMRLLKDELSRRKQLLREKEVNSVKMYNQVSDEPLPLITIALDNYDLVKEELQEMENQFAQIARDGQSLGVFLFLTATRVNGVRQALMNSLKTKVVHYLMDSSEIFTITGRLPFELEAVPGRAVIKKEQAYFSQITLPVDGEDDLERFENIRALVQSLNEQNKGASGPEAVPMLPTELKLPQFASFTGDRVNGLIPVGLDEETVKPVHIDITNGRHWLIIGAPQKGKTNVVKITLETLLDSDVHSIGLADSVDRKLSSFASMEKISYMQTVDQVQLWLDHVQEEVTQRAAQYAEAIDQQKPLPVFTPIVFLIDGIGRLQSMLTPTLQDRIATFMKSYSYVGFTVIAAGSSSEITKGFDQFAAEMKLIRNALVLSKKADQNVMQLSFTRNEEDIVPGYGYFVQNGKERRIQIPLHVSERNVHA